MKSLLNNQYYLKEKIASGGEADIIQISETEVAKVYFPNKVSKVKEDKILYLLNNPINSNFIIQPLDVLYNPDFIGFVMPKVSGISLDLLCNTRFPKRLEKTTYNKYKADLKKRIIICYNITIALNELHKSGYILTDMKPENIILDEFGKIYLIDIDSCYMNEQLVASVITPEYCAPEEYVGKPPTISADIFSMSVIFYKLLLGLHPYTGTAKDSNISTLEDLIKKDLCYLTNPNLLKVIPPLHYNIKLLPADLQYLFKETFKKTLERPSLEKWNEVLFNIITNWDTLLIKNYLIQPKPDKIIPQVILPEIVNVLFKFIYIDLYNVKLEFVINNSEIIAVFPVFTGLSYDYNHSFNKGDVISYKFTVFNSMGVVEDIYYPDDSRIKLNSSKILITYSKNDYHNNHKNRYSIPELNLTVPDFTSTYTKLDIPYYSQFLQIFFKKHRILLKCDNMQKDLDELIKLAIIKKKQIDSVVKDYKKVIKTIIISYERTKANDHYLKRYNNLLSEFNNLVSKIKQIIRDLELLQTGL
jgi:serine/threonine protein kinase